MSESTELREAVDRLNGSIEGLRNDLVRKDVYAADKLLFVNQIAAVDRNVAALARDVEKADENRRADRRLIFAGLVLPIILIIVQVYLSAQTGATP